MAEKVYLCFHHHSDLVWRRTKEDYDKVREEQILHNLGLFDRHPEFRFCFAQSNIMKVFLAQHPEYERKIKKLVEEGKIYFVGGMISIPDTNLVMGESIVRNILLGKKYYREKFGKEVEIAWFMDAFGMNGQIPQILKKSGFKFLLPGRTPGLGSEYGPDFLWKGIDGTEIITAQGNGGIQTSTHLCNLPVVYQPIERMKVSLDEILSKNGEVFAFYATEEGLLKEAIFELIKKHKEIKISQPIDYYKRLENKKLKTYQGELNPEFSGCYTTRIEIKKANRECEFSILNAEKLNALSNILSGDFYDSDIYNYLWEKLSICQFHDGICGCHIDAVYTDLMREMEEIKKISEGKIMQSFSKIIPSGKKEKIVVFNTNFWEREEIVKMEGKEDIVVFENKKLLKTQNYKGDTYFYVKIPPFGYKVLDFKKGKSKEKVINKKKQLENFKFENENYVIKTEGNQLKIKAKFLKYPVFEEKNFGEILFREDRGDLWKENFFGIIMGSKYENERIKEIRQGDVLTSFLIEGEVEKGKEGFLHGDFWDGFESLRWKKEFIFPEKERRFILKVKIEWRGRNTKVMLCFPTKIDPLKGKAIYEIPFGSIERLPYYEVDFKWSKKIKKFGQYVYSTSKGDWPAVNWVDYSDDKIGVGVANKGIPAYQLKGGKIFISLLRSPTAKSSAFTPDVGSYENGSHIYEFSILPHKGGEIEDVIKMGYNLNSPILAFPHYCEDDEKSFISIENATVSAFKVSENKKGYILRIFEATGNKKKVKINIKFSFKKVYETDLLEKVEKEIDLEKVVLKPFEIKTIFIEK